MPDEFDQLRPMNMYGPYCEHLWTVDEDGNHECLRCGLTTTPP